MKKLPALFAVLLFVAPLATAATLWVQNQTQKTIVVKINKEIPSEHFYKLRDYVKSIEPGKWKMFWGPLSFVGPMIVRFQFQDFGLNNLPKGILPMKKTLDLKGMQIKRDKKTGNPMYRQTWPKNKWLRNHPWNSFIKKEEPWPSQW